MARTKEEIAGELAWRYVELVRETKADGRNLAFSRSELHELFEVLATAGSVPGADVQPLNEKQAHEFLPKMVRNELPAQQEKNLMWHMLICPGCFEEYEDLRRQGQVASR